MSPSEGELDAELALLADLSARLLDAHRRLGSLPFSEDEKARSARRLLAINDAAKHDLARASRRLDTLLEDWDAGRVGASDDAP